MDLARPVALDTTPPLKYRRLLEDNNLDPKPIFSE
jgi:hypothetical protein